MGNLSTLLIDFNIERIALQEKPFCNLEAAFKAAHQAVQRCPKGRNEKVRRSFRALLASYLYIFTKRLEFIPYFVSFCKIFHTFAAKPSLHVFARLCETREIIV